MRTLRVSATGRVTLGKDLLRHLGVQPGDQIVVAKPRGGRIVLKAAPRTGKISDVFGMLERANARPLSIPEINDITARGWAGEV